MNSNSPFSLKNKQVFVTGGAGAGVGSGICQAVDDAGGSLIIGSTSLPRAQQAAKHYRDAFAVGGDVSNEADVEAMFETIEANVGPVDYLVNNAGIGLSKPVDESSSEDFDRICGVDLRGVWLMSRSYIRACLRDTRAGAILNISSVHAHSTMPRYSTYAGIKAGVEGFTRGIAVEYGPKRIRCNALSPGYVHAEQNLELIATWADDPAEWVKQHTSTQQALHHEIEAIDCGRAAVFLLSDASNCITGQVIYVDNGSTSMLYNSDFLK